MVDEENDEEIILLYINGEENVFKKLIDRYSSIIYNFTARMTNKTDARDITQEVFIKAWKNLKKFDSSKASFKTWIFTIAKNSITDFLRRKKDVVFSDMEKYDEENDNSFKDKIPSEDLLPDEAIQKLQDGEFLNKTLEKLRSDYLEVLVLHYQEEMTFEEIGKILDKPLNTIKSQHRRAIIELRKIIS